MKKVFGLGLLLGLVFGANLVSFAQGGQNPPPMKDGFGKQGGRGGDMRGMRGGPGEMRDGARRGGMHGGGFGINDDEIFKLNLTNEQKIKLFDFKKKMFNERENMMKTRQPMDAQKPADGMNPDEMRQLMSAKNLGTLTAEQKTKLEAMEAKRKADMDKRKTEMETMKTKMEQTHQEFLNIFTLDQRKQLEQIRAEREKQMQERMKQMQASPKDGPGGGMKKGVKPADKPE